MARAQENMPMSAINGTAMAQEFNASSGKTAYGPA